MFYYTLNKSFLSRFNIKCFQSLCQLFLFLKFSQFFSLSRNQQTAPSPPSSTFMCLWVLMSSTTFSMSYSVNEANLEVMFLLLHALTASNTKRPNLTWLAFNRNHAPQSYITWLPVTLSWVSSTWLLYNLQLDDVPGADFENSLYTFSKSEKRYWVECIVITHSCTGPRMASPQIASGVLQQLLCFLGLLWNPVIWKQTYNNSKLLVAAHLRGQCSNALCKVAFKDQLGFTGVGGSTVEPPPPPISLQWQMVSSRLIPS